MPKSVDLFTYVLQLRRAGRVQRFHKESIGTTQNLAEHSFGVALLLFEIAEQPVSAQLVQAALHHDLHECILGDIPATTMWRLKATPEGAALVTQLEDEARQCLEIVGPSLPAEVDLLKVCDTLDGVFLVLEQVLLGNLWAGRVLDRWLENLKSPAMQARLRQFPKAVRLLHDVNTVYQRLRREPDYQFKEGLLRALPENGIW